METNENLAKTADHAEDDAGPAISMAVIGWGIAAITVSILACTFNNSPMVLGASFGAKLLAVIVGSITGLIGAMIGDAIRRFAHPDAIFTNGGIFQIMGTKLFWLCGPQLIGLLGGTCLGCALVLM
jgi:hypothetical protein